MATFDFRLSDPPAEERARELWIQHAAGLILFEDARKYAIDRIPAGIDEDTRGRIITGINDTLYDLMMILDGVSGSLKNDRFEVTLETRVQLHEQEGGTRRVVKELDLFHGDGMCMGYHGWLEGDFGSDPVATKTPNQPPEPTAPSGRGSP